MYGGLRDHGAATMEHRVFHLIPVSHAPNASGSTLQLPPPKRIPDAQVPAYVLQSGSVACRGMCEGPGTSDLASINGSEESGFYKNPENALNSGNVGRYHLLTACLHRPPEISTTFTQTRSAV